MTIQEFRLQHCSPAFHQISRRSGSSLGLVHIRLACLPDKPGKHLQLSYLVTSSQLYQVVYSSWYGLFDFVSLYIFNDPWEKSKLQKLNQPWKTAISNFIMPSDFVTKVDWGHRVMNFGKVQHGEWIGSSEVTRPHRLRFMGVIGVVGPVFVIFGIQFCASRFLMTRWNALLFRCLLLFCPHWLWVWAPLPSIARCNCHVFSLSSANVWRGLWMYPMAVSHECDCWQQLPRASLLGNHRSWTSLGRYLLGWPWEIPRRIGT